MYFGDYIDNGPEDIQSTSFWKSVRDGAVAFAESYNMFQEKNSEEIAQHVENWIKENVK